ncbi:hypothetical protein ILUMI_27174 [Ignelater luminosus]|uniref:Mitochondrial fission process protein 1 n=1 Tax=Ignelater luminosus TaxID=2038154 RepID=A0A8K0C721_IGNLU|nr:hypothetical protein ILUMI_27174 [Ignelater luminosus]
MSEDKTEHSQKKVDIYRDTPIRYLGYSNEVGEAFRSIIGAKLVWSTYGLATAYVLADTFSKTKEMYNETKHHKMQLKKTIYVASDTLIWQMFASVIIPGFTINRTCALVNLILEKNKVFPSSIRKWVVTSIGLATIPFIIRPIDNLVDDVLDVTLRKLSP